MDIVEMKKQLDAVVNALNKLQISGYNNLCNLQGAIAVLLNIIKTDISVDKA